MLLFHRPEGRLLFGALNLKLWFHFFLFNFFNYIIIYLFFNCTLGRSDLEARHSLRNLSQSEIRYILVGVGKIRYVRNKYNLWVWKLTRFKPLVIHITVIVTAVISVTIFVIVIINFMKNMVFFILPLLLYLSIIIFLPTNEKGIRQEANRQKWKPYLITWI